MKVASQCLQSAYALTLEDKHLEVSRPLEDIFKQATINEPVRCILLYHCPFLYHCPYGRVVDLDPRGSAFIFPPGSRRGKLKSNAEKCMEKCKYL